MEIRGYTECQTCGKSLDQASKGRSRKYCSNACRQKAMRAGIITQRTTNMSTLETKLLKVWNNNHLRYRWFKTIQKYQPVLMDIVSRYDLPTELKAADHPVIEGADGRLVYLPAPKINTVVDDAVAELVHDYTDTSITKKLIGRRVKARLADAIRNSEEFSRLRITKPDGTVERVTRRRSFGTGLAESWLAAGAPSVEGEVTEVLDRSRAARTLEGDERIAYLALVLSHEPPDILEMLIAQPNNGDVIRRWVELADAFRWAEAMRSGDPERDGLTDLESVVDLYSRYRSGDDVRALVKGALDRVSALTGQAPEEIVSGIGRRPREELEGFLRAAASSGSHPVPDPSRPRGRTSSRSGR